jgi:hypothetical protein
MASFLFTVALNAAASILPLNGQDTGQISDRFAIYFVPAGYVFLIWGLIYTLLGGYMLYHSLPSQRTNPRMRASGWLFVLSGVLNSIWIVLWHYNYFPASLVAMIGILLTLIAIYLRLDIGRAPVTNREKWLVNIPFSVYLGWITVATIANATQVLFYLGWNGGPLSPELWTVIMLAVATLVAGLVAWTRRDAAYLLVLVWAFVGIALKHSTTPTVSIAAWAAAAVVGLMAIYSLVASNRRNGESGLQMPQAASA